MARHRLSSTPFASVYPLYVAKAERKGRTKAEVDRIIFWLTGYGAEAREAELEAGTDFETFFAKAPAMNPARTAITGLVCGVRVEAVEEPLMREIRYLDKLIDELAKASRCRRSSAKPDMKPDARAATLALLARRPSGATVCPSEVARELAATAGAADWRAEMPAVHAAVDALVAEGLVRLSWKGEPRARREGAYRIGQTSLTR